MTDLKGEFFLTVTKISDMTSHLFVVGFLGAKRKHSYYSKFRVFTSNFMMLRTYDFVNFCVQGTHKNFS